MCSNVVVLSVLLPFMALAGTTGSNDSGTTGLDSLVGQSSSQTRDSEKPAKIHRYSMYTNEIIRAIWPIIDIRASYPFLIGLETGVILNLTASKETEFYDPINGPLVFTELSYPGIIGGFGANFGKASDAGLEFVRPEMCYSRVWTNRFGLRNRSQYVGTGITGSYRLLKVSFRIFRQIRGYNPRGYLLYCGLGFGI